MTYSNIQGMRAVASLMVFVTHVLWPLVPMRTHPIVPWLDGIGPAGVDVFFVISGFIIYHVAVRAGQKTSELGRLGSAKDFLLKRLIRIYPIYWLVFIAASGVLLVYPNVQLHPEWLEQKPVWALFFLLDHPNTRILAAWTLVPEMYFYAVSAVAVLVFPQNILPALLAWFFVVGFARITGTIDNTLTTPMVFEFLFGIVAAWFSLRRIWVAPVAFALWGVVAIVLGAIVHHGLGGWFNAGPWARVACFGLPASLIVYGVAGLERRGIWTFPKFLQHVGDASYSLYLWHQLLFAFMAGALIKFGMIDSLPRELLALALLSVTFIWSMLSFRYVEKPMLEFMGKALVGRRVSTNALSS